MHNTVYRIAEVRTKIAEVTSVVGFIQFALKIIRIHLINT
jgi:hypothetical protein